MEATIRNKKNAKESKAVLEALVSLIIVTLRANRCKDTGTLDLES